MNQYIWYNREICINKKSLFNRCFIDYGILKISDIISDNGQIMSFPEIQIKYNIDDQKFLVYAGIANAIPKSWKVIIKDTTRIEANIECPITVNGKLLNLTKTCNRYIYRLLVKSKIEKSASHSKLQNKYDITDEEWSQIYIIPFKVGVSK